MPRRGGRSGGFGGFGRSRSSSRSRTPPPRYTNTASRPMPSQSTSQPTRGGGLLSGIGSTILGGMAFGAGSEVGHQAIRGMSGGGQTR